MNKFKTKLQTSNLVLCPSGDLSNPKEPFAILKYNNIEIIIPYYCLYHLKIDTNDLQDNLLKSIFKLGQDEILLEMRHDMNGKTSIDPLSWHRDNANKCSLDHNWQSIKIRLRDPDYIKTDNKMNLD